MNEQKMYTEKCQKIQLSPKFAEPKKTAVYRFRKKFVHHYIQEVNSYCVRSLNRVRQVRLSRIVRFYLIFSALKVVCNWVFAKKRFCYWHILGNRVVVWRKCHLDALCHNCFWLEFTTIFCWFRPLYKLRR